MELIIRGSEDILTQELGNWLCSVLKDKILMRVNDSKLIAWDNYLTNDSAVTRLYKRDYKASEVIIFAGQNLSCVVADGMIIIRFNLTKFVPGFDRWKLSTAIKTLNYGTLQVKGCHVFTDAFNSLKDDLPDLIRLYYRR